MDNKSYTLHIALLNVDDLKKEAPEAWVGAPEGTSFIHALIAHKTREDTYIMNIRSPYFDTGQVQSHAAATTVIGDTIAGVIHRRHYSEVTGEEFVPTFDEQGMRIEHEDEAKTEAIKRQMEFREDPKQQPQVVLRPDSDLRFQYEGGRLTFTPW